MSNSFSYGLQVDQDNQLTLSLLGPAGPTGAAGAAGPNEISTSTETGLTGYIYGDGTNVGGATEGSEFSVGNTLVLRDTEGASEFSSLHITPQGESIKFLTQLIGGAIVDNVTMTFPTVSGNVALTDNTDGIVDIAHGGTNATTAGNARTNLGLGTTDAPTFANLSLASGTITTSQPLSLTQTWNAAGVTFKAIDVNVTDTASASGSLLMDLRVGGVSKFKVTKSGDITALGATLSSFAATTIYCSGSIRLNDDAAALFLGASNDVRIYRDAANTLAQRNGTNAQTTRIYDTYTSATDFHRLAIATVRATATAMSGATVTLTNIIPKGAVVVGVTCKVTTEITGATSFDIGTAADPDRFGAGIGVALATSSDNTNWTAGGIECFTTATSIILTANGGNFTAGAVYVSVQYLSGQAD